MILSQDYARPLQVVRRDGHAEILGARIRLAKQYFHDGWWRRIFSRHHEGTINPRYLEPATMVVLTTAGLVVGFFWKPAWAVPAVSLVAVPAGGLAISAGEPPRSRVLTPAVFATMHWARGPTFSRARRALPAEFTRARSVIDSADSRRSTW